MPKDKAKENVWKAGSRAYQKMVAQLKAGGYSEDEVERRAEIRREEAKDQYMTARPEIYGNTATANTISVPGSGPAPSSAPTPVASKKQAPKKKTATSSASVSVSVGPRKGVQLSLKSKTSQSEHSASIYPGKKRQLLKPVAAGITKPAPPSRPSPIVNHHPRKSATPIGHTAGPGEFKSSMMETFQANPYAWHKRELAYLKEDAAARRRKV